jgi:choice-of-anchor C domain-containing protein
MNKLRLAMTAGTVLACAGMVVGGVTPSYAHIVPVFNLVNDGGFEDPPVGGQFTSYNAGDTFGGWHVDSGGVDLINTYWTSEEGVQSVDMNGTTPGAISQTVNGLSVGKSYQLSFWLAGNPTGGPTIKTLQTSLGGNVLGTNTFDITGKTYADMGWTEYSYDFTAASASTNLVFQSLSTEPCTPASGAAACGPALDNVSIQAVPEAATTVTAFVYVLLSGLVLMIRNRKRATVKASA